MIFQDDKVDTEEILTGVIGKSLDSMLRTANYKGKLDLKKILQEIMKISRNVRNQVLTCQNKKGKVDLKVELELETDPMEIQLSMRTDTRSSLKRLLRIGTKPNNQILVLSPAGYRIASPETLETHRHTVMGQGENKTVKARIASYKSSSISTISNFLEGFHENLCAAMRKR